MNSPRDLPQAQAADTCIGQPLPRRGLERLLQGRGTYVDDLQPPRLAHAVMVRSPYAHARIVAIDVTPAATAPGVLAVATGRDMAGWCKPWVGTLATAPGMRSPPQHALAIDRVCWQGEPVAVVVATTRAQAEDAAERVEVTWEPLPVVADELAALAPEATPVHPGDADNVCYQREVASGDVEPGFAAAAAVVSATLRTGRHTHVTLEPRAILADFNPADRQLTVWHASQVPHMMQWLLADQFGLPESQVRVIVPDVGGSFGLKIHVFGDEMAAVAMALQLGRPVKFVADRLESFQSDVHARGHRIEARMAVSAEGEILAFELDDVQTFGPYGCYPRAGTGEGNQVLNLAGAPYRNRHYRGRLRVAFQHKGLVGPYRAVGHPVACLATEVMLEQAARAVGVDAAQVRRRNLVPDDAYPWTLATGPVVEGLSQQASLERLLQMMDYDGLRAAQARDRARGVHRGIGLAHFVEMTSPSGRVYGAGGAPIASQDACMLRVTASGMVHCAVGITEFGQGAATMVAQVAASGLGVPVECVRVLLGDTDVTPYGGGNWGSRGTGIGGEAVWLAARALRENLLAFAARVLGRPAESLDLRGGEVVERDGGERHLSLEALARRAYFRPDLTPVDFTPELMVTRSFSQRAYGSVFSNGVHASHVEVDVDTGWVRLLRHWVVEDCGTVVNPLLVDEQIRGGVVQGLGAALYEEVLYGDEGQLLNGSLAEYLVPMAGEMPDIEVAHLHTPTQTSTLGAKGAGEAGVAGASAAVLNAVNDALAPFGAFLTEIPITPERVLQALGKVPR
jgi:carbon-monoxide dehydrogenase large subunit